MKLIYKIGDVTEASERAVVHGCNARGRMGSGVALAIRNKFPKAYQDYRFEYNTEGLVMGAVYMTVTKGFYIFNAITQDDANTVRRNADYEAIYKAFEKLNDDAAVLKLPAIAMPRIGAGLAMGNWRIISTIIEETSSNYQPTVYDLP